MNITMTIRVEKAETENLAEFKKKYWKFRKHVEFQQLKGVMPRGEIRWVTATKGRDSNILLLPPMPPESPVWQDRSNGKTGYPDKPEVICGSTLMPEDVCQCRYCDARRRGETLVEPLALAMPISGLCAPQ